MELCYSVPFEIKEVAPGGVIRGIASVYDVEDLGGDIIEYGAARKSISENSEVPFLWQHQSGEVIGAGKLTEWQSKIMIDAALDMDDTVAQKAYSKAKQRLIRGLSIGYQTLKATFEEIEQDGMKRLVRRIKELKIWEVSLVTFPMQPSAVVTRVKTVDLLEAEFVDALRRADTATLEQVKALLLKEAGAAKPGLVTPPEGDGADGSKQTAAGSSSKPDDIHLVEVLRGRIKCQNLNRH